MTSSAAAGSARGSDRRPPPPGKTGFLNVRVGEFAVDGQQVTAVDVARKAVAEANQLDRTAAAVWAVAGAATDAAECRLLLDMLGLDAVSVAHARHVLSRPPRWDY